MTQGTTLRPCATIGILGGGPMGTLTALAARALGYRVRVLDLTGNRTTLPHIADYHVSASPHDIRAAVDVARGCDVLTASFEDVPQDLLAVAAAQAPLRPGLHQTIICQDRQREREWLDANRIAVVPWKAADDRVALAAAMTALRGTLVVKPRTRRHAGFRPAILEGSADVDKAWLAVRGLPSVVEAFADIDFEITVLVARGADGALRAFPPAIGIREAATLAWSELPGWMTPQLARKAERLASFVAQKLDIVGLLAVEMFLLADGRLVVNELVPCPHPTYLSADVACATGQFEQLIRAITGLPLGVATAVRPTAAAAIGESASPINIEAALKVPSVRAFMYDRAEATPGRPVGHLCAAGATTEEAAGRLIRAQAALSGGRRRLAALHDRNVRKQTGAIRRRSDG